MTYNGKPVIQKQAPAACPADAKCCTCLFCEAGGCVYPNSTECWSPGPAQDISSSLPNCLIIGDSVSNQYTPVVTALLNATCKVTWLAKAYVANDTQHARPLTTVSLPSAGAARALRGWRLSEQRRVWLEEPPG